VLLIAGGAWAFTGRGDDSAGPAAAPSPTQTPSPSPTRATKTAKSEPSQRPNAQPRQLPPPTKKPSVVLKSDLAFGFDSAKVSAAARRAVIDIARKAKDAGLTGTILVEGYTDNLGSAAHGLKLSQRRANAVAGILRDHLNGGRLRVAARGLGERDPLRSNATASGRAANRRVTITLPSP
jgi:outer membrane protein OmpA-like peptidoglycan-associated protein